MDGSYGDFVYNSKYILKIFTNLIVLWLGGDLKLEFISRFISEDGTVSDSVKVEETSVQKANLNGLFETDSKSQIGSKISQE